MHRQHPYRVRHSHSNAAAPAAAAAAVAHAAASSTRRRALPHATRPYSNRRAAQVYVPPHPLVKHWLAIARNAATPPALFRSAVSELGRILIYEAVREFLPTIEATVDTPMGKADVEFIDPTLPVKVRGLTGLFRGRRGGFQKIVGGGLGAVGGRAAAGCAPAGVGCLKLSTPCGTSPTGQIWLFGVY
jgi:hypothetical protein